MKVSSRHNASMCIGRIAETARDQLPEWANAEPEIIAYHFTQAGLAVSAVEWWSKAGDLAMRRSAYAEALAHLERALQLADGLEDKDRAQALALTAANYVWQRPTNLREASG